MNVVQELIDLYKENNLKLTDEEIRKAFGDSLKKLREYKDITQNKLAEETLISRQTISVYERGEITPTITNAYRLTGYFGLTIEDFIVYGIGAQEYFNEEFSTLIEKYNYKDIE